METTDKEKLVALQESFQLFVQTSQQLETAYHELSLQLEHAQSERIKVADKLENIMSFLPAGVVLLNENKQIVEMNRSAERILGRDAIHRLWSVVVRNVFLDSSTINDNLLELRTHQNHFYQLSGQVLGREDDPDVVVRGELLLLQDVTRIKAMQQQLSASKRLSSMGEMTASLAHQIRTPLSAAMLYASQLDQVDLDAEKRGKFSKKVLQRLEHLENLVNDMLRYAQGGRSGSQLINVKQLLDSLSESVVAKIAAPDVTFTIDPPLPTWFIQGDEDGIVTAIGNLVTNAVDIIESDANIEIYCQPAGMSELDIVVKDNGPGIEEGRLEKIFEPFYTSRAKGTGLGLAVVRSVADAHNGTVWVKSTLGVGSRFGMRLPLVLGSDTA